MSTSYYDAARLEAARQEELRQNLLKRIEIMKEQLQKSSAGHAAQVVHLKQADIHDEEIGSDLSGLQTSGFAAPVFAADKTDIHAKDFSAIVTAIGTDNQTDQTRLTEIMAEIDNRPVLRRQDQQERDRLVSGINELLRDPSLTIEDVAELAGMRVAAYLAAGTPDALDDQKHLEQLRNTYRALCVMLDREEEALLLDELDREVPRLTELLQKKEEDRYISEVIGQSMAAAGYELRGSCSLDERPGQLYASDQTPLCDVFVARKGSGVLYESVVKSGQATASRKTQVQYEARVICDRYRLVAEEAARHGVILHCVNADFTSYDQMVQEESLVASDARAARRKRQKPQERQLGG